MSSPDLNQQFEDCLKAAKEIVSSYREQAPEGCDPQNSWVYVGVMVVSQVAGTAITASGQKKQAKAQAAAQQKQFAGAQGYLDALASGKMGSLEEMFGSKLDPEAFLYNPVDIDKSQMDTIAGNISAFPSANQLTNTVNPSIWRNDLSRIRTMMPGYDNSRDLYLGATKKLLSGELPFQDVEDVVSNRSGLAGMLGSPGGSRNATLRDLGMSRMDAINQGGSMFQQFIQMAEAISPVSSQMRPQQMMFSPQERLQADILQRSLEQQGRASAAMAEAMPDPAQNALANAGIGLNMAKLGIQQPQTAGMGMQAMGQMVAGLGSAFGSMYGVGGSNMNGGYGGAAQSLSMNSAPRSVSSTPFNTGGTQAYGSTPYGGVVQNNNNTWGFQPTSTPAGGGGGWVPPAGGGYATPTNNPLFPTSPGAYGNQNGYYQYNPNALFRENRAPLQGRAWYEPSGVWLSAMQDPS